MQEEKNYYESLATSSFTKKPQPAKKKKTILVWIGIVFLVIVLAFVSFSFFSNSNPTVSRQLPASENEEIAQLRLLLEDAFIDQVQAYFMEAPDKEEKVQIYEDLMTLLGQAYYRYYVTEGNGTLTDAQAAMRIYVLNFEADGITLSSDSVDYFLERVKE